jgi:hypothetical protein
MSQALARIGAFDTCLEKPRLIRIETENGKSKF